MMIRSDSVHPSAAAAALNDHDTSPTASNILDIHSNFNWSSKNTKSPFTQYAPSNEDVFDYQTTPLIFSILHANVNLFNELVSQYKKLGTLYHHLYLNTDSLGRTPLIACILGIDTLSINSTTLPWISKSDPNHSQIFDILMTQSMENKFVLFTTNFACINYINPFILASYLGKSYYVQQMLEFGCPVDCTDSKNSTALMYAVRDNHFNVIRTLLNHGASVLQKDLNQWCALDYCVCNNTATLLHHYAELEIKLNNRKSWATGQHDSAKDNVYSNAPSIYSANQSMRSCLPPLPSTTYNSEHAQYRSPSPYTSVAAMECEPVQVDTAGADDRFWMDRWNMLSERLIKLMDSISSSTIPIHLSQHIPSDSKYPSPPHDDPGSSSIPSHLITELTHLSDLISARTSDIHQLASLVNAARPHTDDEFKANAALLTNKLMDGIQAHELWLHLISCILGHPKDLNTDLLTVHVQYLARICNIVIEPAHGLVVGLKAIIENVDKLQASLNDANFLNTQLSHELDQLIASPRNPTVKRHSSMHVHDERPPSPMKRHSSLHYSHRTSSPHRTSIPHPRQDHKYHQSLHNIYEPEVAPRRNAMYHPHRSSVTLPRTEHPAIRFQQPPKSTTYTRTLCAVPNTSSLSRKTSRVSTHAMQPATHAPATGILTHVPQRADPPRFHARGYYSSGNLVHHESPPESIDLSDSPKRSRPSLTQRLTHSLACNVGLSKSVSRRR